MEAVAHANLLWLSSDASLGSGFRSKDLSGYYAGAAHRLTAPVFQHHRCTMQGKSMGGSLSGSPKVTSSAFPAMTGGSSKNLLCTQVPPGWGYSLPSHTCCRLQFMICHSVSSSSDFSSVTGEASAPFLGGFVPPANPGGAAAPANAAAAGVLDVTSDAETTTIPNLLRVNGAASAAAVSSPAAESLPPPFNLDSALQDSQEAAAQLDLDLQELLSTISALQIQNEVMSRQMRDYQELLMQTAVALNSKAQEARIEAVKLKKLAILQKVEELRRTEEERKNAKQILQKQEELQRQENVAAARWQASPEPQAPAMAPGEEEEELSCEVDYAAGNNSEEIADIVNYLKESRAPDSQLEVSSKLKVQPQQQDVRDEEEQEEGERSEEEIDVSSMTSLTDSLECVIAHPGALSCTKTVIKKDDARKTALVTMETSVRCSGDACLVPGLSGDDYVALAIQTLVETAQDLRQNRIQKSRLDADPVAQERHAAIVNILAHGRIVGSRPMEPPSRFGHESFVVQLQDEQTGDKIDALFKPRAHGDAQGWHRAPVEYVAYELNLMLGMDLVPPVAYRRGRIELKCNHFQEGAFVYYVRNTKELRRVPATGWGVPVARLLSDTRILDCLLNNSDRHHGHFLLGEHWADRFKLLPVLIDHAAGFRAEAVVSMTDENAFQTGPVRCVSAKTYLRLRFLEKELVAQKFEGILKPHEVEQMMKRRDDVLGYLDNLVAERGYQRTVIEL